MSLYCKHEISEVVLLSLKSQNLIVLSTPVLPQISESLDHLMLRISPVCPSRLERFVPFSVSQTLTQLSAD
jgi:hypothetical protein